MTLAEELAASTANLSTKRETHQRYKPKSEPGAKSGQSIVFGRGKYLPPKREGEG